MKVVLLDPATGGHHLEYASHISRYLRSQGDEVTLATSASAASLRADLRDFTRVFLLSKEPQPAHPGAWYLRSALAVAKGLRLAVRDDADLVHLLYLERSELGALASTVCLRSSVPMFGTLFWPYFVHAPGDDKSVGKRFVHGANAKALDLLLRSRRIHTLFVHSERTRLLLLKRFAGQAFDGRIVVVPDPVGDTTLMSRADARRDLGLPADVPILLFFGETRPDKGARVLLEAITLERRWTTVIAGAAGDVGPAETEDCRRRLENPDRLITRFEPVSADDAERYFWAANAVVLPYRRSFKGTSGVLQRAAAVGVPVIASDVGDIGDAVRRFALGRVVQPESPIDLARELGASLERSGDHAEADDCARRYVAENSWQVLGERVRTAYVEMAAGR